MGGQHISGSGWRCDFWEDTFWSLSTSAESLKLHLSHKTSVPLNTWVTQRGKCDLVVGKHWEVTREKASGVTWVCRLRKAGGFGLEPLLRYATPAFGPWSVKAGKLLRCTFNISGETLGNLFSCATGMHNYGWTGPPALPALGQRFASQLNSVLLSLHMVLYFKNILVSFLYFPDISTHHQFLFN